MDKCRIVTHNEIADDTSQRLVTLNTGRESVPELCTGRFSNGRALCFETSSTGYRHPSFKAECPYQRERQAVMEIEATGVWRRTSFKGSCAEIGLM